MGPTSPKASYKSWRALLLVALGATSISWAAPLVKMVDAPPSAIGMYRLAFAALALLPLTFYHLLRNGALPRAPRAFFWAALSGILFGIDLSLFHRAILMTGAGLATLLANTQVFWVAALSAALLGEVPQRRFWGCAFIAVGGVAFLTVPGFVNARLSPWGIGFAIVAAFFYAGYILSLRASQRASQAVSLATVLTLSCLCGALTLFVIACITGEDTALPSGTDLGWLLVLGLGVHVGGWALITQGLPHLPARVASVTLLLQPVLTMLWGTLCFDEPLGLWDGVGALLTLFGIYLATNSTSVDGAKAHDSNASQPT